MFIYVHLRLSFNIRVQKKIWSWTFTIYMYHAKLAIKVKLGSAYPPASGIVDSKIIEPHPRSPIHTQTLMEWWQTPPGPPRTVCSDRPAAQKWHAPTPELPRPRHQTTLGLYSEKRPIPGSRATPRPTAGHSGAEEIDRTTGSATTPAKPVRSANARRDTQATRRPSRVQSSTCPATPDRPDTRNRRFTTHGTRRLPSEWEQPDPTARWTTRPGPPVTQARPNLWTPGQAATPAQPGAPPTIFGEQLKRDVSVKAILQVWVYKALYD